MEAPVFGSARSACYFTRYGFFNGKKVVLQARRTNTHVEKQATLYPVILSLYTRVNSHLGGPLRQDQLMCSSAPGVLQDLSYKPLVNRVSWGVMESPILNGKQRIRFTARPD
jgi:hypothetical protein